MESNIFPLDRAEIRSALLECVASIEPVLLEHRERNEEQRCLVPEVAEVLRGSPLIKMKSPREVGGAEIHPVDQMDVIEALTKIDSAVAWSVLIASGIGGRAMAALPDETVEELLAEGAFPMIAGSLMPNGKAVEVEGGYRVSGRWAWGSGLRHSDYVTVPVILESQKGVVRVVVPCSEVSPVDDWFSLGMKGTGSSSYEIDDVFVPDRFTSKEAQPVRGGALFRLGYGYATNEHAIFAYALAKGTLEEMITSAAKKKRGYVKAIGIADREVFQRVVGEGELRLKATRLLMVDVLERLFDSAEETAASLELQAEARATAVLCTDEAMAVTTNLFRYAGGQAVMQGDSIQQALRDLLTAQSHLMVSDSAYESLGQLRLGLTDQAPLR